MINGDKNEVSEAKKIRLELGGNILIAMNENEDLPLPNVHRLAKTMMEYFKRDGYVDDLIEFNYRWRPTEDYWRMHIREIASFLAKEKKLHFCFYREQGEFKGLWQFVSKQEYKDTLAREYSDVATRTDTFNNRLDESKWQIDIPHIKDVPLLTN